MKSRVRALVMGTLGVALLVGLPGSAVAGSKATSCTEALAAGSYGKVVVPEGATCLARGR